MISLRLSVRSLALDGQGFQGPQNPWAPLGGLLRVTAEVIDVDGRIGFQPQHERLAAEAGGLLAADIPHHQHAVLIVQ